MTVPVDFPVKPEARPYLDAFEGSREQTEPDWLTEFRRRNLSRFAELGFPTRKSESWRYLDLQPLQRQPLLPAGPSSHDLDGPRERLSHRRRERGCPRLVIVDGRFAPELSLLEMPAGVWFGPTRRAITERVDLLRELAEESTADATHPFAGLNTAFFGDGYVLE